ncbi:hypothetical protein [Actinokineospora enzanensis]|uniref:hypothetical protein n=1 Tax=Actinokineospora enzanensis TaxID=155975 RepID=UPI00035FB039|nr:hypothetical protein [Actinokineospora enzanensis]
MTRVHDMRQAEALLAKRSPLELHRVDSNVQAGPRVDYGPLVGENAGAVEADYPALHAADERLARLQTQLEDRLRDAEHLAEPLRNGTGPVAGPMAQAFLDRADNDRGVRAVLRDYLAELGAVRASIGATLAAYQDVDEQAKAAVQHVDGVA